MSHDGKWAPTPNYPACLELEPICRHVWLTLDVTQMRLYSENLHIVVSRGNEEGFGPDDVPYVENATPRQRTIALIMTLL